MKDLAENLPHCSLTLLHVAFLVLTLVGAVSPASYLFVSFLFFYFNQGHISLSAGEFDATSWRFLLVSRIAVSVFVHMCRIHSGFLLILRAGRKVPSLETLAFFEAHMRQRETRKEPRTKGKEGTQWFKMWIKRQMNFFSNFLFYIGV